MSDRPPRRRVGAALRVDVLAPDWSAGVQLAVIVAVPLAAGLAAGRPEIALFATLGALNAGLADPGGPYQLRIEAAVAGAVITTVGFVLATVVGGQPILGVLFIVGWMFAIGFTAAYGPAAGAVGFVGAVVPIIGLGLPAAPDEWIFRGGWYLVGCLWAVAAIAAAWPLRPGAPVRGPLATTYQLVAVFCRSVPHDEADRSISRDAITEKIDGARQAMVHAGRRRFPRAPSVVAALRAIEHLELGLGAVDRACAELTSVPAELRHVLDALSRVCDDIAQAVRHNRTWDATAFTGQLRQLQAADLDGSASVARDALLVTARELSEHHPEPESRASAAARPGVLGRARSLVHPDALVLRHSLRLAVVVGVAQAIAFVDPFDKSYWIPLTVAVVLKPSLGSSLQRGIQRLAGTLAGLLLGFAYASVFGSHDWTLAAGVVVMALLFAAVLALNYALAVVFITPLVILLLSISGNPVDLEVDRLADTLIGAVLALAGGLWLWPSTERATLPQTLATGALREAGYLDVALDGQRSVDDARAAHRAAERARSNAEAALQRMLAEPRRGWVTPVAVIAYCDRLRSLIETTTGLIVSIRRSETGHDQITDRRRRDSDHRAVAPATQRLAAAAAVLTGAATTEPATDTASEPDRRVAPLVDRICRDADALKRAADEIAADLHAPR